MWVKRAEFKQEWVDEFFRNHPATKLKTIKSNLSDDNFESSIFITSLVKYIKSVI